MSEGAPKGPSRRDVLRLAVQGGLAAVGVGLEAHADTPRAVFEREITNLINLLSKETLFSRLVTNENIKDYDAVSAAFDKLFDTAASHIGTIMQTIPDSEKNLGDQESMGYKIQEIFNTLENFQKQIRVYVREVRNRKNPPKPFMWLTLTIANNFSDKAQKHPQSPQILAHFDIVLPLKKLLVKTWRE